MAGRSHLRRVPLPTRQRLLAREQETQILAYASERGRDQTRGGLCQNESGRERGRRSVYGGQAVADALSGVLRDKHRRGGGSSRRGAAIARDNGETEWWSVEPDVGRVADGVPARVDRLRSLGNAVVPQVAEFIGRMILESVPTVKGES